MILYGLGVLLGPAHMLLYINVIQILKMLAAGLAFYLFLSQFSFSSQAKLVTSYVYGFSGFLLVWGTALSIWHGGNLSSPASAFL